MKPSEQIQAKMRDFLAINPDIKKLIMSDDPNSTTLASAVMIQVILDWLDENFKPSV